jgi:hypothetical protein
MTIISLIPLGLFRSSLFIIAYTRKLPKPIYQVECCKCKQRLVLSHSELLELSKCNTCSILKQNTKKMHINNSTNSENRLRSNNKELPTSRNNSYFTLTSKTLPNITYTKKLNNRVTRIITYNNVSLTVKEWANKLGISLSCLDSRLHRFNNDVNKALDLTYRIKTTYLYKGKYLSLPEIIRQLGINFSRQTLYYRVVKAGLSVEEALAIPVVTSNNQKIKKG